MSVASLRELAASENDDVLTEMLTAGLDRYVTSRFKRYRDFCNSIPYALYYYTPSLSLQKDILTWNSISSSKKMNRIGRRIEERARKGRKRWYHAEKYTYDARQVTTSFYLSIYLSIYLNVCLYVCLYVFLPFPQFMWMLLCYHKDY